jgi:hypothetical protein
MIMLVCAYALPLDWYIYIPNVSAFCVHKRAVFKIFLNVHGFEFRFFSKCNFSLVRKHRVSLSVIYVVLCYNKFASN